MKELPTPDARRASTAYSIAALILAMVGVFDPPPVFCAVCGLGIAIWSIATNPAGDREKEDGGAR